uniref:Uncharacterized protein n=1 Tax=Anguilla anguilla TaxID=7936 RepID=A0A0E9SW04_ANGAN
MHRRYFLHFILYVSQEQIDQQFLLVC